MFGSLLQQRLEAVKACIIIPPSFFFVAFILHRVTGKLQGNWGTRKGACWTGCQLITHCRQFRDANQPAFIHKRTEIGFGISSLQIWFLITFQADSCSKISISLDHTCRHPVRTVQFSVSLPQISAPRSSTAVHRVQRASLKHLEYVYNSAESPELSKHISHVIMGPAHILLFLISAEQTAEGLSGR